MVQIIDNTLTAFDQCLPSREMLHSFCEMLFMIGVDMVELSIAAYERMGCRKQEGKYLLVIDFADQIQKYPGFYRYVSRQEDNIDQVLREVQMNDERENVQLKARRQCKEIRIVGLDHLICTHFDKTMNEIMINVPRSKINFCPENTYGCASALAVSWALEYNGDITASFAGVKNNAATEEVIMALRLAMRHKPNRDLTVLPKLVILYEQITGTTISNKKPVIGKNIFKVEAGIHADGLKKNPATYEAYDPALVGGRSEIIIGKHSGLRSIKLKLEMLQVVMPEDLVLEKILLTVKTECIKNGKSLSDQEFEKIVKEVIAIERSKVYC